MPAPVQAPESFTPVRHFIGWDRPLVAGVVDHLAAGWEGGVLDLSDSMVVVATRQSGRRLREALAERAAARAAGVFPPRVVTTEAFLTEVRPDGPAVATPTESVLVWAAVLGAVPLGEFTALFPETPPRPDFQWALRVAGAWQGVRQTLGEGGLSMEMAAARLAIDGHPEAARWADLARLERAYRQRLAAGGREDAQDARRRAATAPVPPAGIKSLVFVAVSDPPDVAVQAAAGLGRQGLPVAVVVAAPVSRADAFDAWGRPEPAVWSGARDLPLELDAIRLAAGPSEQAERVRALAAGHPDPAATLGLGVADPEVAAALAAAADTMATPSDAVALVCHRPEGEPGGTHELWHVLNGTAQVLRERSFRSLGQWLRFPPVAQLLRRRAGLDERSSQASMLRDWDAYAAAHLPQTLDDGRAFADPTVNLLTDAAERLLNAFASRPLAGAVNALLSELYAARPFPQATVEGASFRAFARLLSEALQQADAATAMAGLAPAPGELLGFVLDQLRAARLDTEDRPPGAVDINGWLELAWEDAPHLVVAGFNDGRVPESIVGDPYLPESLRTRLGLRRTNAARLARDAHQLHMLLASRQATGGRVDVVLGRVSATGDALRPSRLLFLRPDGELPSRAAALFGGDRVPPPPPPPARRLAWRLRVPPVRPMKRVSVTAFRDYLGCPFRFYLRRGLGMESVDPEPRELDAMAFGVLCHAALKALTAEPSMRRCAEETVIAGFLRDRLRQALRETHGESLTVPLRVQLASAEKRLASFARWQAQSVREGWETVSTEVPFADLLGAPWLLGGLEIVGRIDRIDARGNERRIIDYKTSDTPRSVAESHLGPRLRETARAAEWPEWQIHRDPKGHRFAWRDLQLPLYALAARTAWGLHPETGYFHLAKAADDCAYEPWTDLTPSLLNEAEACALAVAEAIGRREFWPPRPAGRFDDFGWMLADDAVAAVDPSALLAP